MFPFKFSLDIAEHLLRELLSVHISWSPIGSCQTNWLANCCEVCKLHANTDELGRQYKMQCMWQSVRIFSFMLAYVSSMKMISYCSICVGPIDLPDKHDHCIAWLSNCAQCADLLTCVLRLTGMWLVAFSGDCSFLLHLLQTSLPSDSKVVRTQCLS